MDPAPAPPPVFLPLQARAVLAVGGPDRRAFLQGLITNDIGRAADDRAIPAALLTPQGRILHDFLVVEQDERLLFDAEADGADALMRRLTTYRLRSRVTIERLAGWAVAAVIDSAALRALGLPDEAGAARRLAEDGGVAFVDPRLAALGARLLAPEGRFAALVAAGWLRGDASAYTARRLALGVPEGQADLADGLAMESGLDPLNALDWKKGCYVGQEVTARMRYRGLTKKRLVPVRIDGVAPPPGTPVTLDGEDVGEMRGSANARGLALIRIDRLDAAAEHTLRFAAGDATLTADPPAWLPRATTQPS